MIGLHETNAFIVLHIVVKTALIDDLGHEHVECGKGSNQSQQVKNGRCLEAPCYVNDIIQGLSHDDIKNEHKYRNEAECGQIYFMEKWMIARKKYFFV